LPFVSLRKAIDFLPLNLRYVNPVKDKVDEREAGLEIDLDEPYIILDVSLRFHLGLSYAVPHSSTEPQRATATAREARQT
jgi:hypothetical protein